jgi:hypothetical protein
MTARPKPSLHEVSARAPQEPAALSTRLVELRSEWKTGQQRLDTIETERQQVRDTMLRISGAIQVLEELSGEGAAPNSADPEPA